MSTVAKYVAAFAGSAVITFLTIGATAGVPDDLLFQPYYWVMTLSLTGLAGLCLGKGIAGEDRRQNATGIARRPVSRVPMGMLA